MTDEQRFFFDLRGWILLPSILSEAEVDTLKGEVYAGARNSYEGDLQALLDHPAIVELGVPQIGAHLFVLYWGISHVITPPVGGALYITSSFTGVDIWRQGYHAMKLGIALFVVPFIFCYHPELLMIGAPTEIVVRSLGAALAMFCIASSFVGYMRGPLLGWQRLTLTGVGLAFIAQSRASLVAGGIALAGLIAWQHYRERAREREPAR